MRSEIIYSQLNNLQKELITKISKSNNRQTVPRMRKYYQATLFIVAVVSLILLLIYRHEYNKLRYVLEVFNYFGKPNQDGIKISCTTNDKNEVKKITIGLDEPLSAWQRLDDDLFVYSSYVDTRKKTIQTISYGKLNNPNLECYIFFDDLLTPVPGIFSFTIVENTSDVQGGIAYRCYILNCKYTEYMSPLGINYKPADKLIFDSNSPLLTVKSLAKTLNYDKESALCVTPPENIPISRADMISFLNFHNLIGMNHFVVYDYGLPNSFHKALKNLATSYDTNFTYEIIPWNFPIREIHTNVIRNIIKTDCIYRTYNKVMYATAITWHEYVVLKLHENVVDLLFDFEKSKVFGNRYAIQAQTFCTQQKDDKRSTNSTPIVLRKVLTSPNSLDGNYLYVYKPHEVLNVNKIVTLKTAANSIILNRYVYCNDYNIAENNKNESSIFKFANDMLNSLIFKRYLTGKMFDFE